MQRGINEPAREISMPIEGGCRNVPFFLKISHIEWRKTRTGMSPYRLYTRETITWASRFSINRNSVCINASFPELNSLNSWTGGRVESRTRGRGRGPFPAAQPHSRSALRASSGLAMVRFYECWRSPSDFAISSYTAGLSSQGPAVWKYADQILPQCDDNISHS